MEYSQVSKVRTFKVSMLFVFLWMLGNSFLFSNPQVADSLLAQAYELDMSEPDKAKEMVLDVYEMGQETHHPHMCAKALASYAWITMVEGDYEGSLRIYQTAMEYCNPDSLMLKAEIYNGIGWVYTRLGNFERGSANTRESIRIYHELGYERGMVSSLNNYGLNFYYNGNYREADSCFNRALELARKMGNRKYIAAIINNLCMSPGNSELKVDMIRESIEINSSLNILWSLGENYNNLGRQYYFIHRYQDALMALDQAETYIRQVSAQDLLLENYEVRTKIYALMNDYTMAFNYSQRQLQIMKQIQSDRSKLEMGTLSNHQKLVKLQQEIRLRKEEERMHARLSRYLVLFAVLCVFFISMYVRWRFYKKKKELELEQSRRKIVELELKKQEETISGVSDQLKQAQDKLGYTMMFVRCRNELLEKIRERIKAMYKMEPSETQVQLKKLNMFISQNLVEEKEDEISREVDRQNMEFCQRMEKLYPDLTAKSKELAVLLRMGLSSKEISLVTGTPLKTVNMNRYRLRKQIGLSPEEDLVALLLKI